MLFHPESSLALVAIIVVCLPQNTLLSLPSCWQRPPPIIEVDNVRQAHFHHTQAEAWICAVVLTVVPEGKSVG